MGSLITLIMPMGWVLITSPMPMGWVLITLTMPKGWGGCHFHAVADAGRWSVVRQAAGLKTNGGGTWPAAASTIFSSGVEDESTAENTRSHVLSFSSI